ncbi:MAG TPA: Na+/H+ antiporter NhaA [Acidimicrobiales bacterium]|nr:Na+/H+ antiporter NhaA [Acidimicrobiales bacterium]
MPTTDGQGGKRRRELAGPAQALPGRRMPRVLRQFLATEAAGGIVLVVGAALALAWANTPWQDSYDTLWHTELALRLGRFALVADLRHWVNEALMALFFLVVGLEIKRELVEGDLREPRAAALPALAAAGGMIVPAVLFLVVTARSGGAEGWGIPIATDIAFALGALALVGPRTPGGLKLFLLSLAIVDDIGAIVVIAVFYSDEIDLPFLAAAAGLVAVMVGLRRARVVWVAPYVVLGIGVWLATRASGVHATIAGVVLGLLAPARPLTPAAVARRWATDLADDPGPGELEAMTRLAKTSVSPAQRLEHLLHPWTSFVVLPLFALANAGVPVRSDSFDAPGALAVALGVVLGLVVGKTVGITLAASLAVRSGLGRLPEETTWASLGGAAFLGGIGFTVSLFIAELAYDPGPLQDAAKLGVLAASTIAALAGTLVLDRASRGT